MTMLSLGEAARLIPGATVRGDAGVTFERVSTDSRTAGPGDLFVALKGERFDAHDFLGDVAARGAAAALVAHTPAGASRCRRSRAAKHGPHSAPLHTAGANDSRCRWSR